MQDFNFQKTKVYREGSTLAKEVLQMTKKLGWTHKDLKSQLERAVSSIPANIAEGWGRYHPKEKRQFYRIALGSTNESVSFLEIALSLQLISPSDFCHFQRSLRYIAILLVGLLKALEHRL
jgi:four helix bundle protein